MSNIGGANYLPPIVTELKGDTSNLNRAFAEATAAEKAFAKATEDMGEKVGKSSKKAGADIDDFTKLVVRRTKAGEDAVSTLRREIGRLDTDVGTLRKRLAKDSANQGLFFEFKRSNDELRTMRRLLSEIGPEGAQQAGILSRTFGGFFSSLGGAGSLIVPGIIGAITLALPAIAALIGSAVTVGLGLGFAGIGVVVAALLLPKIRQQFYRIGQNFKDAFKFAISGAFDDELRRALRTFNTFIPTFGKQFRSIFDAIAPALNPLAEALGQGLKGFLAEMMQVIPQIMPALLTFVSTIPDVMRAVAEFLVAITRDGPALSRFILDASNAIIVFLGGAGEVISWLTRAYGWIVKLNDAFPFIGWQRQLIGLGELLSTIGKFFADLWDNITAGASAVGSWFANLGKTIWSFLTDAGAAVADWFTRTVNWFKLLPGRVVGFLSSMPGRVQRIVADMAHRAAYWVGFMVGQWLKFVTEAPGRIGAAVSAAWGWIVRKFQEGVSATIANIRAFPGQVAAFFMGLYVAVTGWVRRTWESVTGWFARTRQDMINRIASAITAVIGFFQGLPSRTGTALTSFRDRVLAFFKGARDWLYEAGKNIVRGIIDGVASMWDWAVNKVKSFAHDIWKGFTDALGIHSPSKMFAEAGQFSAMGYVKGWMKSMPMVQRMWNRVTGKGGPSSVAITGAAGGGGGIGPVNRGAPPPAAGGGGMVYTTVVVSGKAIATAVTPATQQRARRSGPTGLGFAAPGIM